MSAPQVIVVGAGVIGCASAFMLARAGARVRVLERDVPGAHASAAAAGMFAPLAESEGRGPLFELGVAALEAFPELARELTERSGIDVGWVRRGLVRVFRTQPPEAASEGVGGVSGAALRALKLEHWDARQARTLLPGLDPSIVAARFSPLEGVVDPVRLTRAYRVAAERAGARFEVGAPVHGLVERSGRVRGVRTALADRPADHVVWCTGAWSGELELRARRLPVEPVKGQMLSLESDSLRAGPLIWADDVYLVPRDDGLVRVGATMERVGFDTEPRVAGMLQMLRAALRVWPGLADARFEHAWAGLRPITPDGLPALGPWPELEGLTVATGHGRHGILLSGLSAERVCECALGVRTESSRAHLPWASVDPARLLGG